MQCGYLYACGWTETLICLGVLAGMVWLLAWVVWFHDHKHNKPWTHKCGWIKIDGMIHFYRSKDEAKRPQGCTGGSCNALKCAAKKIK